MEDRKLNEKESLELISQMIQNTRMKMEEKSGMPLVIWGYVTIFTTIVVWLMVKQTGNHLWNFLWFILPLLGGVFSLLLAKREAKKPSAKTYITSVISNIWLVLGFAGLITSVMAFLVRFPILFVVALLMGIGATLTGAVTKYRPLVLLGGLGIAISFSLLFVRTYDLHMLIFAVDFLLMMVIPGHIMNAASRKRNV
ncbi:hypothetical protein D0T50_10605 [Bacteroides sp. 214]|uniref:hypothetical protein n=1 Tax=Bacteroides sp. 214 TaxID=2302935 RepID=UPI0013D53177|nr:hypothetical protein [Bacteroides sp. 214]NDW13339.1 hypothetical protein [Bacteroides sp. 214]